MNVLNISGSGKISAKIKINLNEINKKLGDKVNNETLNGYNISFALNVLNYFNRKFEPNFPKYNVKEYSLNNTIFNEIQKLTAKYNNKYISHKKNQKKNNEPQLVVKYDEICKIGSELNIGSKTNPQRSISSSRHSSFNENDSTKPNSSSEEENKSGEAKLNPLNFGTESFRVNFAKDGTVSKFVIAKETFDVNQEQGDVNGISFSQ